MSVALSTLTPPTTASTAEADQTGLADDFDTFLTLLTEQLQNQDPLEPMDSSEFISQLVEFSSVEQQIKQNDNLEELISVQSSSMALTASTYIGADVMVKGATAELQTDTSDAAKWYYELNGLSETTTLTVRDANNAVVFETEGQTAAGVHEFVWDGLGTDGTAATAGTYTIEVTATDADANAINVTTAGRRRVDGIDFSSSQAAPIIDGEAIDWADIIQLGV